MKKIMGSLCYGLGGLTLLVAFKNVAKVLGPEGDTDPARLLGYLMGTFLIPVVLLWLGYALRKDDSQT